MISLMPGPVEISDEINTAFRLPPISHRSAEFIDRFESVRTRLCGMTGAAHACLMNGSGTLANEAIASCLEGPGVVLVNGEFGERLARQAQRWDLPVNVVEWPWGVPWDLNRVADEIRGARWIWGVHLETSTGMLNDVASLSALAQERGVRLCLDSISSLGAVPLNLSDVWLASGVSGKALGAFSGIAMVFANEEPRPERSVPAYLDVAAAMRTEGPCFTFPSPLLLALERALDVPRDYALLGCLVRRRLRALGVRPMVEESLHAPVVTTFAAPAPDFVERCRSLGYWIGGESGYLAARKLVQIANMGAITCRHIDDFFDHVPFQEG
jgi:aspartate aminotransferase-like enzyme